MRSSQAEKILLAIHPVSKGDKIYVAASGSPWSAQLAPTATPDPSDPADTTPARHLDIPKLPLESGSYLRGSLPVFSASPWSSFLLRVLCELRGQFPFGCGIVALGNWCTRSREDRQGIGRRDTAIHIRAFAASRDTPFIHAKPRGREVRAQRNRSQPQHPIPRTRPIPPRQDTLISRNSHWKVGATCAEVSLCSPRPRG